MAAQSKRGQLLISLWHRAQNQRGRQAKPASVTFNYAKTLAQTALISGIFLVIGPLVVFQIEGALRLPRFSFPVLPAFALFFLGAAMAFWSQFVLVTRGDGTPFPLDSTRRFVVSGPYRFLRNPMAFGSLLQGYAIGLFFGSPLILAYVYAGTLVWNYGARPWEERDLEEKFGAEFLDYKAAVRCWWPRLFPYKTSLKER